MKTRRKATFGPPWPTSPPRMRDRTCESTQWHGGAAEKWMGWKAVGWSAWLENLVGGFNDFLCSPRIPGKMIQFDEHIFQMGWFNHQLSKSLKNFRLLCPLNKKYKKSFQPVKPRINYSTVFFSCFLPMQLAFLEGLLGSILWIFKKNWVQPFPQKSHKNPGHERNHLVCGWRWQQRPRSYVVISAIELEEMPPQVPHPFFTGWVGRGKHGQIPSN